MRVVYLISSLLAATALSSAVPRAPAEDAELIPIEDTFDPAEYGSAAFGSEDEHGDNEEDDGTAGHIEERGLFDSGGRVCKKKNKKDCYHVQSNGRCINLVSSNGKPFISGAADGQSLCTVYSEKGCPWIKGKDTGFDERGANFGFNAKSMQCSTR